MADAPKKSENTEAVASPDDDHGDIETGPILDESKSGPIDREIEGPFDASEASTVRPYVDLGSIKVLPREGIQMRLDVEEGTQRIVAVSLDFADSTIQLQAFASPRSTGLWHEVRNQIQEQLTAQKARITEVDGIFGPELEAHLPTADKGTTRVRFIGVDGPRWLLRGVISGAAVSDKEAAEKVEELFRSIVVVRGDQPMPPRDLLPLRVPAAAGDVDGAENIS